MLQMTDNIYSGGSCNIAANGTIKMKEIWSADLTAPKSSGSSEYKYPLTVRHNSIYNTLGIRAKFKTLFNNKDVR
jgi:hypothetical protein